MASLSIFSSSVTWVQVIGEYLTKINILTENSVKYSKRDFKNQRGFKGSVGGTVRLLSKIQYFNTAYQLSNLSAETKNMSLRIFLGGDWTEGWILS